MSDTPYYHNRITCPTCSGSGLKEGLTYRDLVHSTKALNFKKIIACAFCDGDGKITVLERDPR